MLGHYLWQTFEKRSERPIAMCGSAVSTAMLSRIAKVEGFHYRETLTGFKNIGAMNIHLREQGYNVLFSFEEAIGFCCGEIIPDKDGISAIVVFAELCIKLYQHGRTVNDHMKQLYKIYGEYVCKNGYFRCNDPAVTAKIMDSIRRIGRSLGTVKGYKITSFRDLGEPGYDSMTHDKKPVTKTDKNSPLVTLRFENGCVAHFRSSGTEPKFKYYIEMAGRVGCSRDEVIIELDHVANNILEELLSPEENGLLR